MTRLHSVRSSDPRVLLILVCRASMLPPLSLSFVHFMCSTDAVAGRSSVGGDSIGAFNMLCIMARSSPTHSVVPTLSRRVARHTVRSRCDAHHTVRVALAFQRSPLPPGHLQWRAVA